MGTCNFLSAELAAADFSDANNLRRSQLPQTLRRKPRAHVYASLDAFTLHHAGEETTGKCITSTRGVDDLVLANSVHGERLHLVLTLDSDHSWLRALGNDSNSLSLRVLLWQVGQSLGNGRDVVCVKIVRVSVRDSLSLIANHIVPVLCGLIKRVLEELRDERCRERQDERLEVGVSMSTSQSRSTTPAYLVVFRSFFGKSQNSRHADCEMVSTDEVSLCFLCDAPVLLQVLNLVRIRCSKIGAHASVVTCDNDTASASWLLLVIAVLDCQTGFLVCLHQDVGILVLSDAAEEDYLVRRKQILAKGLPLASHIAPCEIVISTRDAWSVKSPHTPAMHVTH